jgi:dolichol-phosphate mannosyltransferase
MHSIVVIPTYNEIDNIRGVAQAVLSLPNIDLLIVDDNSPDGTGQVADQIASDSGGRMHVLHRTAKNGLGRAYVEAFGWCIERGYEAIGQMDADFSHDPKSLPEMFAAAGSIADVVIGSRYLNGISVINWPLRRILLSLCANEYVHRITKIPAKDATAGFRVYTSRALLAMHIDTVESNGYSFQVEMTYRAYLCGCRIVEIPIVFTERRLGHSKMSKGVIIESAKMPWLLVLHRKRLARSLDSIGTVAQESTSSTG